MASFKDTADREWLISIDAMSIMRVREDVDPLFLKDDDEHDTYTRIYRDPVLLCRVIYLLCEGQRKELNVDEESFYMSVIGDAIDAATGAMLEAIVNFTPLRSRKLLKVAAAKAAKIQEIATARAIEKISDPAVEAKALEAIDATIDAALADLATPRSSVSKPRAS